MANYLAADDVLVLPERAEPHFINSANGYTYHSSVKSWSDGALLVTNNRTRDDMTRVCRGILGLGPGAVVAL